jgi:hemerythrin superfamily protein
VTDLWKILQADHDRIWELLDRLTSGSALTAATVRERRTVAGQLAAAVSGHETAEERVIWPAVRELCSTGGELARHAQRQEAELMQELSELARLSAAEEEFDVWVYRVSRMVRAHLSYEQEEVWPKLGSEFRTADTTHLTAQWLTARWQTARGQARAAG